MASSGCASYEFPRTDSGRIDEEQVKRDIDIEINEFCRIDTENGEFLCECETLGVWCI